MTAQPRKVRVTLPPTMHRAEVFIANGLEIEAPYMFWHGVLVEQEFAYPVDQRLAFHEEADGYRYLRDGNRFALPPAYKFETFEEEEV
jgi:hypothetical protein